METITTTTTIKTPEPENERIHQAKPLSFSNGVLKRHHSLPLHHHLPHHHAVVVTYKECLKNHAASMGGHALDGCGEFMPSPNVNPSDPTSLKCAACGCHRNFHRREPEDPPFPLPNTLPALEYQPHRRHHPPPPPNQNTNTGSHSSPSSPSPPPISSSYYHPSAPHMLLSLNSSGGGGTTPVSGGSNPNTRKRFRTKFSQSQKEKMLEFAERIEWKIQKRDEEIINGFCNEIGVEKGVLKVWMHNNKNKKDPNSNLLAISTDGNENGAGAGVGIGIGVAVVTAEESSAVNYNHHHVLTATTNGSASSS